MKTIVNRLTLLKSQIDDAEKNVTLLKGQDQQAVKQLKEEFGVSTEKEAEALLKKKIEARDKVALEIKAQYEALEEDYSW